MKLPLEIRSIVEKSLLSTVEISEEKIEALLLKIQLAWPKIPWQKEAFRARVENFAKELETLSRKHSLWIYGPLPAQLPRITGEAGGEAGYRLEPDITGYSYSFNRILK